MIWPRLSRRYNSQREVVGLDEQIRRLEASADIRGVAAIRARLVTAEAAQQACAAAEAGWHARVADRQAALEPLRTMLARAWPDTRRELTKSTELDNS